MSFSVDIAATVGGFSLRVELPSSSGTTVVVGPNGAGKTTLLRCLLGVTVPEQGVIVFADETVYSSKDGINVPIEDRRLGYLPQRYALFPHLTVAKNVGFGIEGEGRDGKASRVAALLESLGIGHLGDRRPRGLSGGESQRVALARALAIGPRALLLDEPMAALDVGARRNVRKFLGEKLSELDIPTVVVSHDIADAEVLADQIAVLEAGKIVQFGSLEELRRSPASPFVKGFVSS